MTAAAISKRMKAKGLGRLRWYCQMCEKQCRDENGFKCHTQSAGHQRQLQVFSEDPSSFIARFSDTFRKEFLLVLRRRYGTNMVNANTVYQEYIKDRDHLHMNATKWTTLSEFTMEMGREGLCRVEERDDGWWMSYVDRLAAQKDQRARDMDRERLAEERRAEELLKRQLQMAKRTRAISREEDNGAMAGMVSQGPILMEMKTSSKAKHSSGGGGENALASLSLKSGEENTRAEKVNRPARRKRSRFQDAPRLSVLEDIMRSEKSKVAEDNFLGSNGCSLPRRESPKSNPHVGPGISPQEEPWVREGIVVKVTSKEVGHGSFYNSKGKVSRVIDQYGAQVHLFDAPTILELDQGDLETVIPKPGGKVLLLFGPRRGEEAKVTAINVGSFSVDLTLSHSGQELKSIAYEAVSRLAD